ncbi:MAG: metallophosphoesterase family protein [Caldilineaceae bacterium SB0664_bin_27]|uniref:Metallophosphoesterase family protein n=1 Tax=Caldilineaceae bacterium SB0664_bin_27 TaxID=2605260 RepID=A0A6B0YT97_9CHLR|nr:metallophosphoesterase family protein [Caldilineaceae bacterium SB0664_bin_27]
MNCPLRLAFLGDIHGNLPALESVLADIDKKSPDAVFLLGDLINRCPWTLDVLDLLRQREWLSVQGNHDLVLAQLNTPEGSPVFDNRTRFPNIHWTWQQLRPLDLSYLRNLPHDLLIEIEEAPPLRLFHGLPDNLFAGIVPNADEGSVAAQVAVYDEPILICGHTHQPMDRTITVAHSTAQSLAPEMGQQRILNPGSVGMPYNGDPRAHYLLLDLVEENGHLDWQPQFRRLAYDFERVARTFHSSGLVESSGAIAKLNLRTIKDGQPWASDYQQWVRNQPHELRSNPEAAVDLYLQTHGPSQWAFGG